MKELLADPRLQALRGRLLDHPVYAALHRPEDVCTFMEHHVFCVWDFQSLLKGLQKKLTCVDVPWLPTLDPEARRLVNEIVLGEESDEDGEGGYLSHFELYLEAMRHARASLSKIERLLTALRMGRPLETALNEAETPRATAAFVRQSMALAVGDRVHSLAAAFALGREDLIPAMFVQLLERLGESEPGRFGKLQYYLQRHITLDGEEHAPRAVRIVERICAGDPGRLREARATVQHCYETRLAVWDEVLSAVRAGEACPA